MIKEPVFNNLRELQGYLTCFTTSKYPFIAVDEDLDVCIYQEQPCDYKGIMWSTAKQSRIIFQLKPEQLNFDFQWNETWFCRMR